MFDAILHSFMNGGVRRISSNKCNNVYVDGNGLSVEEEVGASDWNFCYYKIIFMF